MSSATQRANQQCAEILARLGLNYTKAAIAQLRPGHYAVDVRPGAHGIVKPGRQTVGSATVEIRNVEQPAGRGRR